MNERIQPNARELRELFEIKYGHPDTTGWAPRRRLHHGYFPPGDIYEATIRKLVGKETRWLDIGGGRSVFPHNEALSKMLAETCQHLTAVDPSENVLDNPYAHDKHMCMLEDYESDSKYDLATFRMVAEHIEHPSQVLNKLNSLLTPDGVVVIYTINKYSPVPLLTYITPFSWHYRIKKLFWGGEERDTFPVQYKMNTRRQLQALFTAHGFREELFMHLDDLSTLSHFKTLNFLEIGLWKVLRLFGLRYPENNLLGVYRRMG
jgi:2-polyprenyl-3-methyl-5-hydroxy-6-metoxy-1,4-benzoquinol methylase